MDVKQIYTLVNNTTKELLGTTDLVVAEDLSNLVDVGNTVFSSTAMDKYVKTLINQIAKIIFVNRKYSGSAPSVLMDSWEFGSVVEKIRSELPDAVENESWELEDGASYDPNIFYKPTVSAKFFNSKTTFEIPVSICELQVKQSFQNAEQMNALISMLYNEIDKKMTVAMDNLVMRTIDNFIGETFYNLDSAGTYTGKSGVRCVNLAYLYNTQYSKSLTASQCLTDPDFIRFAIYTMGLYEKRLTKINTILNMGGKERFTPAEMLHTVLHSDFVAGASAFLYSDTFHENYVSLPKAEIVPCWQGIGTGADAYKFSKTGTINVKTSENHTVNATGIIGVMFDRDALGVTCLDKRVTSNYNPKAEFTNNWFKQDAGYFNDFDEQFVVFYVATA